MTGQSIPDAALLPAPRRRSRNTFLVPIALYGGAARLQLPHDLSEAEARKIAAVVLAYARITPFNSRLA